MLLAMGAPPATTPVPVASPEAEAVLAAAEGLFSAMKARNYPAVWRGLSAKSQRVIVKGVRKALAKVKIEATDAQVRDDFARGGELARGYWDAYLVQFDPRSALEESKWDMGKVKKDEAEIVLLHKKSDHPAILKMFREDGAWKVGLDETFSPRSLPQLLGGGTDIQLK